MDNNIYSIDSWSANAFYFKNKILTNNNLYYYVAFDYTSSLSINTDIANGNLLGYIYDNGQQVPFFSWKSSYHLSNDNKPRIRKIQFGDSYWQSVPDGINTLMLKYDLTFENRNLAETTAILHFLMIRNGVESFIMLPPAPRGQFLRFKCEEWTDAMEFFSNYTIKATFIQSPV